MWRQIAAVSILIQLSTFAALITPNHEVALNCDPIRDSNELFTIIDCFLIEVKSSNDQVLVATTSLDMNELNSENKTIWINIAGNANYPQYFPKNLSKTIDGVGFFFYKKTPLKYVTRDDLKDLASGLTRLCLGENELTDIQYDTFYDLHKLEYLDIRFNHIKSLPSNLFENSPNLNSFWIESNEISALHPDLFKNCPNFEILYAEFNKIEEFHEDLLKNNPKMIIISMRHNKIKNIPYDFTKFEFLEVADFTHNGGTCDTMFFDFHPYDEYYDENEQKKWIKTIPEFQKKVEETCRS